MLTIDCHAHILPEHWPSLKERYGYGGFITLDHYAPGRARMMKDDGTFFRDIAENTWNVNAILRDMDRKNVDVMVLCTVPVLFNYWAKPEHGADWSQFLNNHLAEVVRQHPKRIVGLGTLPMQDVNTAVTELTRCIRELGMPGVQIGSNINGKNLDDPEFFPLWEAAQLLNASIFVHPWEMFGANRLQKYFQQWLVGMPAETTLAITSMIFGGVFDAFPNLKVMFAHAGGSFPFTIGRINHGYHARLDLCNVHSIREPKHYLGRFWVDSITHDANALRFLISVIGADKIAMGSDYPFPLGDLEHGAFIKEMADLDNNVKQQILQDSTLDFLGLEASLFR